ncbi:hypothetical protein GCM10010435_44690 [Winogradskya consettensis]|uniref:DUF4190 domain-containing protein n=1 Tax=Winogradskya consettensis TaxID=113560 RepID=A0A919T2R2_9ACTN|nr:DUF4190 domain-containing protein [Actinoplanes consettensis]GIM82750.1 hypothetical protein Aco04nite_83080 [Actinoplanes consettensis]
MSYPPEPPAPGPQGQPQPVYVQPVVIAAGPPTSAWAVTSLIFGIIGVLGGWCFVGLPCIVAVIAGHFALKDTRHGARSGRGQAVAGLILGYPFAIIWILGAVFGGIGAVTPTS